jgi:hypothetical protein
MFGVSESDFLIIGMGAFGTAIFTLVIGLCFRIRLKYCLVAAVMLWLGVSGTLKCHELSGNIFNGGSVLLMLAIAYFFVLIRYFKNTSN